MVLDVKRNRNLEDNLVNLKNNKECPGKFSLLPYNF